jgi:hypothetical protein
VQLIWDMSAGSSAARIGWNAIINGLGPQVRTLENNITIAFEVIDGSQLRWPIRRFSVGCASISQAGACTRLCPPPPGTIEEIRLTTKNLIIGPRSKNASSTFKLVLLGSVQFVLLLL